MYAGSRSLASYFDDTSKGISTDWHDQMEAAASLPDKSTLGTWMYHPGHSKQIWVPDSAGGNPNAIPHGYRYKEKPEPGESTPWNDNDWGKEEYEQKKAQSEQKPAEKKEKVRMTNEQKAQAKKERASMRESLRESRKTQIKALHDECYAIMSRNGFWDETDHAGLLITHLSGMLPEITRLQAIVSAQRAAKKAELKAVTPLPSHKIRDTMLHQEVTSAIDKTSWTGRQGMLQGIDHFCKVHGLSNTLGTTFPVSSAPGGALYLSVASLLLSKAKEVLMDGMLHIKAVRAKAGRANADECRFVNLSYQAKTIINKKRGKDKYPRESDKKFADSKDIDAWRKHIRSLELAWFMQNSAGKSLPTPKHLQEPRPPQRQGPGKGKKNHRGKGNDFENAVKEFAIFKKIYGTHNNGGSHRQHHHGQPVHESTKPPNGRPFAVPAGGGGRGRRPNMAPGPPPRASNYMQGYTYYCD
jgi:hypothetical protein